jgi:phospholipase C
MVQYDRDDKKPTGKIAIQVTNREEKTQMITVTDNSYRDAAKHQLVGVKGSADASEIILLDTTNSFGWYDFSVRIKGNSTFERRYAGRVETGSQSKTDPSMGRLV